MRDSDDYKVFHENSEIHGSWVSGSGPRAGAYGKNILNFFILQYTCVFE